MRLIDKEKLIEEYDRVHEGPAGGARKLMEEAPTVDAIPVAWIKEKIQSLRNENSYTSYHLSECFKALLIDWRRGKKREQTD